MKIVKYYPTRNPPYHNKMKISFLIFILLIFNTYSSGQTANFTFSTSNNLYCSPQVVTFTATAPGNVTGYIWDFGDGQSGGNAVENHLYNSANTYYVTLTVVYANAASSITKSVVINPAITVSANANTTSLCQPGNVMLTANASGTISTYQWDFGDATPVQTTSANTISHDFTSYGTFNVSVIATSTAGCTASNGITIQVSRLPISGVVSPANGCLPVDATLSVNITFPPGDGLQNIAWDFGDGSPIIPGSSPSIVHQYNTTNPITNANVSVTSNQGCTNQYTFIPFAYGIPPTNINAYTTALRDSFCGSEIIEFYGYADSANSYRWDFGDGITEITSNNTITHKYKSLGTKQVVVTPFYNGCAGTGLTISIFIKGVIADYTYANTCSNKSRYNFINNSLGPISSFEWTFSDVPGFVETTNNNPTHTFPPSATSVANLLIVDNVTGCRDSLSSIIYTATPSLISNKMDVCLKSDVTYRVQNTYPPAVGFYYEFHVNGGIVNNGGDSIYTLNTNFLGTFNDYVVIKDTMPGTCEDTLNIVIVNVRGPVIDFSFPGKICMDSAVTFINNSYPKFASDSIITWKWEYGDGQKDSVKNPAPHKFLAPARHTVKLQATDINGCTLFKELPIEIAALPSLSVLPAIDTLCLGQSATLVAYTSDSLIWITNTDISCTSCDTVVVNPTMTTNYIAKAVTINGCKNYDTSVVKVFRPINLSVSQTLTSVCPGIPVQFNLNTTGITTWNPSTFLNDPSIQNPIAIPDSNITYTIIVKDSVGCFTDTVTASIIVFPRPIVEAGIDRFLPYNAPFTLAPNYGTGTRTYLWTPQGSLSCTNCPRPFGAALKSERYTIEITDVNNCKAKDSITIFVGCEKSNLLLPTAFTPNGDQKNETFFPFARGYRIIKSFTVFNRNGAKVFERKNFQPNIPSEGWDGKVKGGITDNIQTYVWVIEGICDTGTAIVTKGSVVLIK